MSTTITHATTPRFIRPRLQKAPALESRLAKAFTLASETDAIALAKDNGASHVVVSFDAAKPASRYYVTYADSFDDVKSESSYHPQLAYAVRSVG